MATINVTENLMGRLNPKWVERFRKLKSHEQRVALLRDYPIQSGEEEAVIQLLIDKLDPAMPSVTRVTQVREEMQRDEAKGANSEHGLDKPEGEKYWQEKLDTAAKLDEIDRKAVVTKRHEDIRKLFPGLLPPKREDMKPDSPTDSWPAISVNPATKEATVVEPPPIPPNGSEISGRVTASRWWPSSSAVRPIRWYADRALGLA